MQSIYLDNNATTRPTEEVVEAMLSVAREDWANPSSAHRPGQAVRRKIDLARQSVCQLINCQDRELIFTSGGTEAANLAINGSLAAQPRRHMFVTSSIEHSAVHELAESLSKRGVDVHRLPNDVNGVVDVDALERLLIERANDIAIVSIMWTNNETGVIQPVETIGRLCRDHGVRFHTDATAWVGKMPTDMSGVDVDLLSFAGHKFHGPKGIGGLYVRDGVRVEPVLIGGGQERDHRGGTENVIGIVGLGVAADLAKQWVATDQCDDLAAVRDGFEQHLCRSCAHAVVIGADVPRIWNTSSIAFPAIDAEVIVLMLSERGVCVSAGAACSSGSMEPSHVLTAMGLDESIVNGALRFSLSRETNAQELDRAVEIVAEVERKLRSMTAVV